MIEITVKICRDSRRAKVTDMIIDAGGALG